MRPDRLSRVADSQAGRMVPPSPVAAATQDRANVSADTAPDLVPPLVESVSRCLAPSSQSGSPTSTRFWTGGHRARAGWPSTGDCQRLLARSGCPTYSGEQATAEPAAANMLVGPPRK